MNVSSSALTSFYTKNYFEFLTKQWQMSKNGNGTVNGTVYENGDNDENDTHNHNNDDDDCYNVHDGSDHDNGKNDDNDR